jgi:ubiquinone biosynthesis protein COQ9
VTSQQQDAPQAGGRSGERETLLMAALPHVPFDGWNSTMLHAGAADAGIPPEDVKRLFPGGAAEAIRLFSTRADQLMAAQMTAKIANAELEGLGMSALVKMAIRLRIEALGTHREAARRAAGFFAMPQNTRLGMECLSRTVNTIWRAAGDRSTDFSFYTKRATLTGVYGATLLYWLDDNSESSEQSWAFLDRRIEDTARIHRMRGRLQRLTDGLPNPFKLIKTARTRQT